MIIAAFLSSTSSFAMRELLVHNLLCSSDALHKIVAKAANIHSVVLAVNNWYSGLTVLQLSGRM